MASNGGGATPIPPPPLPLDPPLPIDEGSGLTSGTDRQSVLRWPREPSSRAWCWSCRRWWRWRSSAPPAGRRHGLWTPPSAFSAGRSSWTSSSRWKGYVAPPGWRPGGYCKNLKRGGVSKLYKRGLIITGAYLKWEGCQLCKRGCHMIRVWIRVWLGQWGKTKNFLGLTIALDLVHCWIQIHFIVRWVSLAILLFLIFLNVLTTGDYEWGWIYRGRIVRWRFRSSIWPLRACFAGEYPSSGLHPLQNPEW